MLLFSPADSTTLYFGTQYVMKTVDGGLHWQTISPDLTGRRNTRETQDGRATDHRECETARLRRRLHHCTFASEPRSDLGRQRYRINSPHARWREKLERRHAPRSFSHGARSPSSKLRTLILRVPMRRWIAAASMTATPISIEPAIMEQHGS